MSVYETLQQYNLFDNSIFHHGFLDNNRDYLIKAELFSPSELKGVYSYLFIGCVELQYKLLISEGSIVLDNTVGTDVNYGGNIYKWVNWAETYPGWKYSVTSNLVEDWKKRTNSEMHQITIETNVYSLLLIFHDLIVTRL